MTLNIDRWVCETVSGTRPARERKLGRLLRKIKKGDILICSEISRLGRCLMEVMGILNTLMARQALVLTVKERYELGNNIQSQILAFAFGLAAQIERDLISQPTHPRGAGPSEGRGCQAGQEAGREERPVQADGEGETHSNTFRTRFEQG